MIVANHDILSWLLIMPNVKKTSVSWLWMMKNVKKHVQHGRVSLSTSKALIFEFFGEQCLYHKIWFGRSPDISRSLKRCSSASSTWEYAQFYVAYLYYRWNLEILLGLRMLIDFDDTHTDKSPNTHFVISSLTCWFWWSYLCWQTKRGKIET